MLKLILGEVTTFAGSGQGFNDGNLASAKFNGPVGVAVCHATGVVYVSDHGNHRIQKITPNVNLNYLVMFFYFIGQVFIFLMIGVVSTFAGTGSQGAVDGQGISASFNRPLGVAVNQTDGCLYVADYGNHKIRKITPQGSMWQG